MQNSISMINIHEAKTHLSRIVDDVKKFGKPMLIAKAGKPQVKIVPLDPPKAISRFGFMQQEQADIPDNFDQMFADEIQAMFEGKSE